MWKVLGRQNMNDINQNEKTPKNRKIYAQKFTGLKDKIEERRKKVYLLDLQGFSDQEIAKQTGVSLSTIEKDLHYMKYYCVKWYRDLDCLDGLVKMLNRLLYACGRIFSELILAL